MMPRSIVFYGGRSAGQPDGLMVKLPRRSAPGVWLRVPRTFDAAEFLPPEHRCRADDAYWMLDLICRKMEKEEIDGDGYAHLHTDVLRRVMRDQTAVVRDLVAAGVLDPPSSYRVGHWSRGYRLNERHRGERLKWVQTTNARFTRRFQRERARLRDEEKKLWLPIDHQLEAIQREHLTITGEADALVAAMDLNERYQAVAEVGHIRHGQFRYRVKQAGRRINAVTQLARELRQYLRLGGEKIVGLDVRCAQPALLATLMGWCDEGETSNIIVERLVSRLRDVSYVTRCPFASGLPGLVSALSAAKPGPDFPAFLDAVDHDIYNDLVHRCMEKGVNLAVNPAKRRNRVKTLLPRDRVKTLLLQEIIARKGNYGSPFQEMFGEAYPSAVAFVRHVQRAGGGYNPHGEMIRVLQRLESRLIIEQVAPLLVERGVLVVTLHDALYVREQDAQHARATFGETCDRLGLTHIHLKKE